jgi:UDP-GlcNAc3NAcA epimerase
LLQHMVHAEKRLEHNLKLFELQRGGYYLLTLHRAENTSNRQRLSSILKAVKCLDKPVLFPVHPRTRQILAASGISLNGNIRAVPPLGFLEMIAMERHAKKILTDSGGVQKEAFYLGVPCVTLRDRTEWPETVKCGANLISGPEPDSILKAVAQESTCDWSAHKPYGSGASAQIIVNELLGMGSEAMPTLHAEIENESKAARAQAG